MKKTTETNSGTIDSQLASLEERHRELARHLSEVGLVLRGTITPRRLRGKAPSRSVTAEPARTGGVTYIWTRKVAGKTVTATLPAEHIDLFQQWSRNMREFDRIVSEMQDLGLKAAALLRRHP